MKDIYDIYEWDIEGIPSEFFFYGTDYNFYGHEEECWKESVISGLWVSTDGRFYNRLTRNFCTPTHGDGHGHKAIKVSINGVRHQAYAHRLIALAFIPNPHNYPIVRHLDDDPNNNEIGNLAWGTMLDNHADAVNNGTYKPFKEEDREKSYEQSRLPVELTELSTGRKLYFKSINEAARGIGTHQANLWKVLHNERPSTVGYSGRIISKEEYDAQTD